MHYSVPDLCSVLSVFSVPAVLKHQLQLLEGSVLSPFLSDAKIDLTSQLNELYITHTKQMV